MQHVDLVVIGAGPAGSCAAAAASNAGASTLMIDKRAVIGEPVQCGELVPLAFLHEMSIPMDLVVHWIATLKTTFPSGRILTLRAPGGMLDRGRFDRWLADEARNAGVRILAGTQVVDIDGHTLLLRGRTGEFSVTTKYILAADGPNSFVARTIGLPPLRCLNAVQCRVPLNRTSDAAEIFFKDQWRGGYGWVFPKGLDANVGIGMAGQGATEKLREFLDELRRNGRISDSVTGWTGGRIPVEGFRDSIHAHVLFVGDAAGQTHAISGGGIPQAVIAGRMAGTAVGHAIRMADPSCLNEYPQQFIARFGDELIRAVRRRTEFERDWDDLESAIERCWVACPEYYQRRSHEPA